MEKEQRALNKTFIYLLLGYGLPILIGLKVSENPNVLFAFVPMLFHYLLIWYGRDMHGDTCAIKKEIPSSGIACTFGLLIVGILFIFPSAIVMLLSFVQFLVSWTVYASVRV